jgi:hypothetical protein
MSFSMSNNHPSSFISHLDTIPSRLSGGKMRTEKMRQMAAMNLPHFVAMAPQHLPSFAAL